MEHPIIHRPEEPALDPVTGLPSPGALENLPGISRALSGTQEQGGALGLQGVTSWEKVGDKRDISIPH